MGFLPIEERPAPGNSSPTTEPFRGTNSIFIRTSSPSTAVQLPCGTYSLAADSEARKQNRTLPTPKVLSLLHQQLPAAYRLAEVVGKWVWVTFKEQPSAEIRQQLAQLGFHWNRERQSWQHPCGQFSLSSNTDPHEKTTIREANNSI